MLSVCKVPASAVVGTSEDAETAFQLWLCSAEPSGPTLFGSGTLGGFHSVPTVGCYSSDDVSPALPIALVSLPASCARGLPLTWGMLRAAAAAGALPKSSLQLDTPPVDVFLQIHGALAIRPCGHLRCLGLEREWQIFAQPWLFAGDIVGDGRYAVSAKVLLGVGEATGVAPCHSERGGGGAPFGALAVRPCSVHDGRFSPCTASLAAATGAAVADTPAFVSVLVDAALARAAVTLHVLPLSEVAADRIRSWVRGCATLRDLLAGLRANLPHAHALAAALVSPGLSAAEREAASADVLAVAAGGPGDEGAATVCSS